MTTTTNPKKESPTSESAVSQVQTVTALPDVMSAHTTEQLNQSLMLMERHATDLVASDVVRNGYMAHGHPAGLGWDHLQLKFSLISSINNFKEYSKSFK